MANSPLCPHCSAPLVDAGDVPTFNVEPIGTGRKEIPVVWMVWCGKCGKTITGFPPKPITSRLTRTS